MAKKTTDDAVMELLVRVAKKKEEIKKMKIRPQWKTNCTIGKIEDSTHDRVNIQTVRNEGVLMSLYAFLLQQEKLLNTASEELKLEYNGSWQGYSIDDWKSDLKSRANQLLIDKKEKELQVMDNRVNKLVSPDQRREMELEALQAMLGD